MATYRKGTLEARLNEILPDGDGPFRVVFHELWRDAEGGWSVNDSWYGERSCDRERAIEALRGRWEVFKVNYLREARVRDLTDASSESGHAMVEVDCTSFADVYAEKEED